MRQPEPDILELLLGGLLILVVAIPTSLTWTDHLSVGEAAGFVILTYAGTVLAYRHGVRHRNNQLSIEGDDPR